MESIVINTKNFEHLTKLSDVVDLMELYSDKRYQKKFKFP